MTLAPLAPPQTYCAASQTNMIIHKYTNTKILKYTNTQIHKYTNTQIHKYTPELCMTLAPLAPPQTYCAASQTNTTQRNPLRGGSNDASRKKLSFIIKQISIIEDKSHKWVEGLFDNSLSEMHRSIFLTV